MTIQQNIWRYFKKGILFDIIIVVINFIIMAAVAINIETIIYNWQTIGLTALLLIIGMVIVKGLLIEKINIWVKR